MTSRARDKRRRGDRYTGVLRGSGVPTAAENRPLVQHGTRGDGTVSWWFFSGLIVLSLSVVLLLFFASDAFYVRSVTVGGLQYLTKEEIFAYADIANIHLFWIDPDHVRRNVLRSPAIADARVSLGWPPNMVQIIIEEREPVLLWEQNGVANWVDLRGRMMSQQEDRPDLIRVVAEANAIDGPLAVNEMLAVGVVNGALQLQELMPDVKTLRYDANKGLGFKNENGWDVWFGTGINMPEKVMIYTAIANNLRARGIQPGELNLSNPDAPVYNVLWGR